MKKIKSIENHHHRSLPPMDPSSWLPPSLHLAVAVLLGASFMALSAFYIHRCTVEHALLRLVELHCKPLATSDDEDDDRSRFGDDDIEAETDANLRNYQGALSRSVDDCSNVLRSYRITSSMPNVVSATDWFGEDAMNHASSLENLLFVCRDFCLKLASQILKHIFIVL